MASRRCPTWSGGELPAGFSCTDGGPAWEWFQSQFGDDFKPELTREQFQSAIESFPEDYDHIEVPVNP